ncbi:hypothetical protein ACHQM5_001190 [Ranunculus cassubicifolius]
MVSKSNASVALFVAFNLLFFSLVTAKYCPPPPPPKCPPPPKKPTPAPKPKPTPTPTPTPSKGNSCPIDTLKLGVCANLLGGLVNVVVGPPSKTPCCTLLKGLVDLDAAVCLCTAIKANILGINLNVPISLTLLLNQCGCKVPSGFKCA